MRGWQCLLLGSWLNWACGPAPAAVDPGYEVAVINSKPLEQPQPIAAPNRSAAKKLANEGDQIVKVNVAEAISKYEQALEQDATDPAIHFKLAMARSKTREWQAMAEAAGTAAELNPSYADYHYRQAEAMMQLAVEGDRSWYARARKPLEKCIQADPNLAECHHLLGEVALWTGDDNLAAQHFTHAIEVKPAHGSFYPPLIELYMAHKNYTEANQVAETAEQFVPKQVLHKAALYRIADLQAQVKLAQGDAVGRIEVLNRANQIAGDEHPEIAYELGLAYATLKPPKEDDARRLLTSFHKRACNGQSSAKRFADQCNIASAVVQRLGQ